MKILVAVDEAADAEIMFQTITHHEWRDPELTLLSVVEPLKIGNVASMLPGPIVDQMFKTNWENAQSVVTSLAARLKTNLGTSSKISAEVLEGKIVPTILQFAEEWSPDLILVGSHKKSGFGQIMLGSVALHVVAQGQLFRDDCPLDLLADSRQLFSG